MRRVLRDIRHLAADLAKRGLRDEADRVLAISAQLSMIMQPERGRDYGRVLCTRSERVRDLRWVLLTIQDTLRGQGLTNTQDALTGVLSQLRAIEYNLEG